MATGGVEGDVLENSDWPYRRGMRVHSTRLEFDIIILPFVRDEALSKTKVSMRRVSYLWSHVKNCGIYDICFIQHCRSAFGD